MLFPNSLTGIPVTAYGREVVIITRTKNRPVLLVRALASVLAQTYQDWHLFVVNDGGDKEELEEVIAPYRPAFDNKLTVIHHEVSKGMEAASNAALFASKGDFVAVHDDDDSWHPDFLERCVDFLNKSENLRLAAVATNCTVVRESIANDIVVEETREAWGFWRTTVSLSNMLNTNNFPPICLLTRRSVVSHIGPFNADLPVLGDWDYNLRILSVGDIGTINEPLAYYHQRSVSAETDVYGNSVGAGQTKHTLYGAFYSNSLIRPLLQKEPGYIGLLHILLRKLHEVESEARDSRWALGKHLDWVLSELNGHHAQMLHKVDKEVNEARYALHEHIADSERRLQEHIADSERRLHEHLDWLHRQKPSIFKKTWKAIKRMFRQKG